MRAWWSTIIIIRSGRCIQIWVLKIMFTGRFGWVTFTFSWIWSSFWINTCSTLIPIRASACRAPIRITLIFDENILSDPPISWRSKCHCYWSWSCISEGLIDIGCKRVSTVRGICLEGWSCNRNSFSWGRCYSDRDTGTWRWVPPYWN